MHLNRTAVVLAATLAFAASAASASGYPSPSWRATGHVTHGRASFAGVFNLDPSGVCKPFDYSGDPNVEPDLGPSGSDSCGGSPELVTVTLRLYRAGVRVYSTVTHTPVRGYKGRWSLTAPCRGGRWVATLVNPWQGTNRTVAGSLRCSR